MRRRRNHRAHTLDRWLTCTACGLAQYRRNVVLGRGTIPAPVLFIGEAPGKGEDLKGRAFCGPAGRWLDAVVKDAGTMAGHTPAHYVTNIVACRPTDVAHGDNREPTDEECLACRARLVETVALCKPDWVIFLGEVAERQGKAVAPDGVHVYHPSYLMRLRSRRTAQYDRTVRDVAAVFAAAGKG